MRHQHTREVERREDEENGSGQERTESRHICKKYENE